MDNTLKLPAGVIQKKPYLSFHWQGKKVDLREADEKLILRIAKDPKNSILGLKDEARNTQAPPAEESSKKATASSK